mmetsp:Transcript_47742/g.101984  ORF Transcript_47742/g.101984 Transcript_47742/m.101984 type:complete len:201 (+) Transcript_47742:103-705(+)
MVLHLQLAQLVPRDLPDGGILRARAGEVDDDELVADAAGLRAIDDLANLGVDVRLLHRPGFEGRPQLAHLGHLLDKVAHILGASDKVDGQLLLRRLVRARGDDRRVRTEPLLLEDDLRTGRLREDHIRAQAELLRRLADGELDAELVGHLRRELLGASEGIGQALEARPHCRCGASHHLRDCATADEADLVVVWGREVLD